MPSVPESQGLEGYTDVLSHNNTRKCRRSARTLGTLGTRSAFGVTVSAMGCEILASLGPTWVVPGLKFQLLSVAHSSPSQAFINVN